MTELVQLITTGGAIVVLTWVVWNLVMPNGTLAPRWMLTASELRIEKLEKRLDRALASGERVADVAEKIAPEAKRAREA